VVAGDDDRLAVGSEPAADLPDHRLGDRDRAGGMARDELEHVTEQHEAVDPVQGLQQAGPGDGPAQDVVSGPASEVQIRDDQRAHGGARYPSPSAVRRRRPARA
jgi:hypothetical protein